jgi:dienelactone hydrolase
MGFKDWGFLPYVAERLARAGLAGVSFTFSGAGVGEQSDAFDEPERFGHNTYTNELRDLDAVLDAVTTGAFGFQPSAYGLFGHSAGGGIAVLRAAQDERVRALVTWAAVARFGRLIAPLTEELRRTGTARVSSPRSGRELPLYRDMLDDLDANGAGPLDVVRAAGGVRAPWLIVHGTADQTVPWGDGRDLHNAARTGDRELFLVDGAGHGFGAGHPWAGSNVALEQVVRRTVDWFARHLA